MMCNLPLCFVAILPVSNSSKEYTNQILYLRLAIHDMSSQRLATHIYGTLCTLRWREVWQRAQSCRGVSATKI